MRPAGRFTNDHRELPEQAATRKHGPAMPARHDPARGRRSRLSLLPSIKCQSLAADFAAPRELRMSCA
jgi:hypothetical protein